MIPRIIHYAWFSGEKKPPEIEMCILSWKKHAYDFEIIEWNSDTFPWQEFNWTRESFEKRKWAFATDFFRLWVLDRFGGIYLDSDVELNLPLTSILKCDLVMGLETKTHIGPHFLASIPQHPFINMLLKEYLDKHFIVSGGGMDQTPMPVIITKLFKKKYGKLVPGHNDKASVMIYSENILTIDVADGKNVSCHRMSGSWMESKICLKYSYLFLRRYFWNEFIDCSLSPATGMESRLCLLNIKLAIEFVLKLFVPYYLVILYMKFRQKCKVRLLSP